MSKALETKFLLGSAFAMMAGSAAYAYGTQFEKKIVVDKKYERIKGSQNSTSQIFMVSDSENNHYRVKKTLWYGQFYATELWSEMEPEQEYDIKGYGVRFGFLGMYPNIYEANPTNNKN